jgi:hypothetical protein
MQHHSEMVTAANAQWSEDDAPLPSLLSFVSERASGLPGERDPFDEQTNR